MSWIADRSGFRDFLSVVAVEAPDFDADGDLDLDTAFSVLKAGLGVVLGPNSDRSGAESAIEGAYQAYLRKDSTSATQILQALDVSLFSGAARPPAASIGSYGGPRILLPKTTAALWLGVADAGDQSHYQLACEVGELGIVDPWKQPLVVLGCAPLDMFAMPRLDGALIYAWEFGRDDASLRALVGRGEAEAEWSEPVTFESGGGVYAVIDAAVSWRESSEHLEVNLAAGRCEVRQTYMEHGDVAVTAYRFRTVRDPSGTSASGPMESQ